MTALVSTIDDSSPDVIRCEYP